MAISINQITSGTALNLNNGIFIVSEYQHVKPGKGSAFVRVKMKSIESGQVLERTFKSSEKLEDVPLEERRLQHLYDSGDAIHFMDNESFEETVVPKSVIGDDLKFLQENIQVTGISHEHKVLKVILPTFIEAAVTETEPGFRGDTSKAGTKPATIETGATIQVPLFIEIGEKVKIDTRTGEYVERVKK